MLPQCLEAIQQQTYQDVEVVIVDSGSIDDTLSIATAHKCSVVEIPSHTFTFGHALNIGAAHATGEIMVAISAHCIPADNQWLSYLVQQFKERPNLAGVYGKQIPFPHANPIEKRGLQEAFPDGDSFVTTSDTRFSNANSAVRKSVWKHIPFDKLLSGAEDIKWCADVLKKEYVVGYEPRAVVFHSHKESLSQIIHRFERETVALLSIKSSFFRPHSFLGYVVRWGRSLILDYVFLCVHLTSFSYAIKWTILLPFYRMGVYYGQYKGTQQYKKTGGSLRAA